MTTSTCTHDLVLFGSDEELIDTVAPFVADGVAAGDRVLVHGDPGQLGALHEAVSGPGVESGGAGYATPIATLSGYQRLCDAETASGRGVRAIAPIPVGSSPAARADWTRYEALVARALGPYRFAGLCLYDTRVTPPELIERARDVHRHFRGPTGLRPNAHARPDLEVLRDIDGAHPWPPPPPDARTALAADLPAGAGPVAMSTPRHAVREALRDGGLPHERAQEYLAAISEVLTNALQHGRGPVQIRLLTSDDRWWCTVTDHGSGIDDPYTGIDSPLPGNPGAAGTGLWVARQLCDHLTINNTPSGASVVLHQQA
ncbi:MAG TPA: sensor histidine kinase [Pseudonocardia sp.]|nr:sensor histidine kinase [Pseudonocardia sp.]